MSDKERPGGERFAWVDPERTKPANAFDDEVGVDGVGYSPDSERAEGEKHPSGDVNVGDSASDRAAANREPGTDIAPENGRRASFDSRTGEVHGSGSGTGGGNPGEDFDSDSQSGDGYPQTGSEGLAKSTHDSGPPRFNQ